MIGKITIVSNQYRMFCICLYQKGDSMEGVEVIWEAFEPPPAGKRREERDAWVAQYFADLPIAGTGRHLGIVQVLPYVPGLPN
jgi:hypothetical protein